jgi:hypothetical protein
MKKLSCLAMLCALSLPAVATAQSTPAPSPSPSTGADAAVAARAESWLRYIQAGKIDRSQLTAQMNSALTDARIAGVSAQLAPLGDPLSFALQSTSNQGDLTIYVYRITFKSPAPVIDEAFVLDDNGKIAGLWFKPAQ